MANTVLSDDILYSFVLLYSQKIDLDLILVVFSLTT